MKKTVFTRAMEWISGLFDQMWQVLPSITGTAGSPDAWAPAWQHAYVLDEGGVIRRLE